VVLLVLLWCAAVVYSCGVQLVCSWCCCGAQLVWCVAGIAGVAMVRSWCGVQQVLLVLL
jgi:hypothetical protein